MIARKLAAMTVAAALLAGATTPSYAKAKFLPGLRPNVAVTVIFASAISVIFNAIVVAATQCRELTSEEAGTAVFVPVLGAAYNLTKAPNNMCKK